MADQITMDGSGRVVIPARVRRELALAAGALLEIEFDGSTIQLRPVSNAKVEQRGGRLVITSELAGPVPDHRDLRDERTDEQAGDP